MAQALQVLLWILPQLIAGGHDALCAPGGVDTAARAFCTPAGQIAFRTAFAAVGGPLLLPFAHFASGRVYARLCRDPATLRGLLNRACAIPTEQVEAVAEQAAAHAQKRLAFGLLAGRSIGSAASSAWAPLIAEIVEYWSFYDIDVKANRAGIRFSVPAGGSANRVAKSIEVRGPVSKPTVWVGGVHRTFASGSPGPLIKWMDQQLRHG